MAISMPAPTPFDDLDPFEVLRAKDIADRLHVDPRSVRRAIARGELPASRACGLRVLAVDAAAWWRARAVVPVADAPVQAPPSPVLEPAPRPRRRRRFDTAPARLPLPERAGGA